MGAYRRAHEAGWSRRLSWLLQGVLVRVPVGRPKNVSQRRKPRAIREAQATRQGRRSGRAGGQGQDPASWPSVTLPARMHDVQTDSRRGLPSTMARTLCTLGYQRLLVRLCEWLMLMPTDGRLPQTSQTAAIEVERIPADR